MSLSKDDYEADLALLDRYQTFSAELVRVSLLGVGVLGFFFDKVAGSTYLSVSTRQLVLTLLACAAVCFGTAAAAALAHRFLSSDGFFYHLRGLRRSTDALARTSDERQRNSLYRRSGRFVGASAALCGLGCFVVVAALFCAVLNYQP